MKKVLCVLLAVCLCIGFMAGCSGKSGTDSTSKPTTKSTASVGSTTAAPGSTTTTGSGEKTIALGELPLAQGSPTLTVMTAKEQYSFIKDLGDTEVWQKIEEITGVNIDWQLSPSGDQYDLVIQTRMSAGINLPDIVNMSSENSAEYGRGGVLIELSEYVDKYGYYMKEVFEMEPKLLGLMRSPEGNIYNLATISGVELMAAGPVGWLIRKDWLDDLGLNEPETVNDWLYALREFKNKDVNKNGDPSDEFPFITRGGYQQILFWSGAWDLHMNPSYSGSFYPDSNGRVEFEWFKPEAKEVVYFLRTLFEEGLIDPESLTNTKEQYTSKITNNNAGSTIQWQEYIPSWENALKETGATDAKWIMTRMPHATGYKGIMESGKSAGGNMAITKDCKDPVLAFRLLDYIMFSDEAAKLLIIGLEGVTYNIVNGKIVMTDFVTKNPDGLSPVQAIQSIGAWQSIPRRAVAEYITYLKLNDPELSERALAVKDQIVSTIDFSKATDEEDRRVTALLTDIRTCIEENLVGFMTGSKPMSEWDSFLQELKNIGIDELLEIRQAQYDRLMKK